MQAELALANQFLDGRGTPRDNTQAFAWYKKAAQGGDMTAQYVAGSFYERGGDGVERNLNVARAYYAAAAAQGDPAAKLKYLQLARNWSAASRNSGAPLEAKRPFRAGPGTAFFFMAAAKGSTLHQPLLSRDAHDQADGHAERRQRRAAVAHERQRHADHRQDAAHHARY